MVTNLTTQKSSHPWSRKIRKLTGGGSFMSAAMLTCRLLSADMPQTTPLTLPQTTNPQKFLRALQFQAFDLLYAQTQLSIMGLPVGFYHFVARNYSEHY
jgi:hypothetical protein